MSARNSVASDTPSLDAESVVRVMTVHRATYLKLVRNNHGAEQLADFFIGMAATYARLSQALRREAAS